MVSDLAKTCGTWCSHLRADCRAGTESVQQTGSGLLEACKEGCWSRKKETGPAVMMNSGDSFLWFCFVQIYNLGFHDPSEPVPHVLEADLENKQRQIGKFPDFFLAAPRGY